MIRADFEALAEAVCRDTTGLDRASLSVSAESSDFLRFNQSRVRQATHVRQCYGTVGVVRGARRATTSCSLSGDLARDIALLLQEKAALARQLDLLADDPYLLLPEAVTASDRDTTGRLPEPAAVMADVARLAAADDFVGFLASGPVVRAFADSLGQRHWHRADSFHFEWCLYRGGDRAAKASQAGRDWDAAAFEARLAQSREAAAMLERPRRALAPGAYRALFSPAAVADLLHTLGWGGFGERALRTGVSSLAQLHRGERQFHPSVQLVEATAEGLAPSFFHEGFTKPPAVPLVLAGRAAGSLVSPRSAREYGQPPNAGGMETPESLRMAPGTLRAADALQALGTGVYVSDLHYLNYSERQACRLTGMTRFACLWVEDGVPVAPIAVMRFDDSLLRMFGPGLLGLTDEVQVFPENLTYGARQLRSITAPGALVEGFRFAL